MKIASLLTLFGLSLASLRAEVDLSKLPPVSSRTGVTYEKDIRPIFEASCFRCHGEERHRGELRLDSLEAALKGGEDKVIVPGKSKESLLVIAVAQLDDEKAMPPKRGPGGPGGAGGPGGRGGFGPGNLIATQLMAQGDKDQDQKLSKAEMSAVAESWFTKLDADKSGKLTQQQFVDKLGEILPAPQGGGRNGGPGGPGGPPPGGGPRQNGGRGFNPSQFIGPGFFSAVDSDKDGNLTRAEFKGTFEKWFAEWDGDKSGLLDETKLRTGLNAALPRPNFAGGQRNGAAGGPNGNGPGPRGNGGGPGQQGPGGGGPPAKPLTPEQVGLVRAWIDQGAK